jgi:hypothetical protein
MSKQLDAAEVQRFRKKLMTMDDEAFAEFFDEAIPSMEDPATEEELSDEQIALIACVYTGTKVTNLAKVLERARRKWVRGQESTRRLEAEAKALGYDDGELFIMSIGDDGHFHPQPKDQGVNCCGDNKVE